MRWRTLLIAASASALAACGQVAPAPSDFASPSATQTATAAVPAPVMKAVARARSDGQIEGPVEWISTTTQRAAAIDHTGPAEPDVPIYAVQIRGRFTLDNVPRPSGAQSPHGTVLVVFIPIENSDQGGVGLTLTESTVDLSLYGTVHTFAPS